MQLQKKLHGFKYQILSMGIGLVSGLCAIWVEPLISPEGLDLLALTILTTLNIVLWMHVKSLRVAIGGSVLAISFHLYCDNCFGRQIALTFIMTGGILSLCSGIRHRKSKRT